MFEQVTPNRGFLPAIDPLTRLPGTEFEAWEEALTDVPKRIVTAGGGSLQRWLEALPAFPTQQLTEAAVASSGGEADAPIVWRAMLLLSFLSHAYMWGEPGHVPQRLPSVLAVPWAAVARMLGVPPVLTYATYNLCNWRRLDPSGPLALGNICCLHNFYGGIDEEHFRLVHIDIEAKAAAAVHGLPDGQAAAAAGDEEGVRACLLRTTAALEAMCATLECMGEKCDPYIYYSRVRLPMSGWRGNPLLPQGLVYEGVSQEPLQLYGETGAQSSIVPAFDAALGVSHEGNGWLYEYLTTMEGHMPAPHQRYIRSLRAGLALRKFVSDAAPSLRGDYNDCIMELEAFRSQHMGFAHNYIHRFNEQEKGTGGSDFMPALRGYRNATHRHLLP